MTRTALDKPRLFLNRHWQWMVFNQRMEMPFSVKGAQFRERVCNEILPAYLLWIIARRACWGLRGCTRIQGAAAAAADSLCRTT